MKTSEQIDKIAPAFIKAQAEFGKATKDSTNPCGPRPMPIKGKIRLEHCAYITAQSRSTTAGGPVLSIACGLKSHPAPDCAHWDAFSIC